MGSCSSKGLNGGFAPIFFQRYGGLHEIEISVSFSKLSFEHGINPLIHNYRQAGQTSVAEVSKRDLRAELLLAEQEAREKKRKAEGKPGVTLALENGPAVSEDDEASKRRKLLQEALGLDKDDDDDDEERDTEKKDEGAIGEKERLGFCMTILLRNLMCPQKARMKMKMKMRTRMRMRMRRLN